MSRTIQIDHNPSPARLRGLQIDTWPTWRAGVPIFTWTYGEAETCYILGGEAVVTPEGDTPVTLKAGDLATFPAGMDCTWEIRAPVRKHYRFG